MTNRVKPNNKSCLILRLICVVFLIISLYAGYVFATITGMITPHHSSSSPHPSSAPALTIEDPAQPVSAYTVGELPHPDTAVIVSGPTHAFAPSTDHGVCSSSSPQTVTVTISPDGMAEVSTQNVGSDALAVTIDTTTHTSRECPVVVSRYSAENISTIFHSASTWAKTNNLPVVVRMTQSQYIPGFSGISASSHPVLPDVDVDIVDPTTGTVNTYIRLSNTSENRKDVS